MIDLYYVPFQFQYYEGRSSIIVCQPDTPESCLCFDGFERICLTNDVVLRSSEREHLFIKGFQYMPRFLSIISRG